MMILPMCELCQERKAHVDFYGSWLCRACLPYARKIRAWRLKQGFTPRWARAGEDGYEYWVWEDPSKP